MAQNAIAKAGLALDSERDSCNGAYRGSCGVVVRPCSASFCVCHRMQLLGVVRSDSRRGPLGSVEADVRPCSGSKFDLELGCPS